MQPILAFLDSHFIGLSVLYVITVVAITCGKAFKTFIIAEASRFNR